MTKEENCSSYVKLSELQDKIQVLEQEVENFMLEWEELNSSLEKYDN